MRPLATALLILATAMPALAETDAQRAERCAAQAQIVGQAVEMRKKRQSETKVKDSLLAEVDAKLAPSVPLLVGYVFTLNRKDLKLDVAASFAEQCTAYNP